MNKQGNLLRLGMWVLLIFTMTILIIFAAALIFESLNQFAVQPIGNISIDLNNQSIISNNMTTHILQLADEYENFNWYPDFWTFYALLIAFILTSVAALRTRKSGWLSFSGWSLIGSYFFLLIAGFILQFLEWFWGEYFEKLFFDLAYSVKFTEWVLTFGAPLLFFWWLWLVFLNTFETFGKKRKKEFDLEEITSDEDTL